MSSEIKKLIAGNAAFRKKFFNTTTIFDELVAFGQRPKIMIISCSDSRVDPAMVFDAQPGELFVVRNVANLVPPCEQSGKYHGTSAALEFAVRFLQVEHIIILGHSYCGGIQALIDNAELLDKNSDNFIAQWMQLARPAYDKMNEEHASLTEQEKNTRCEQYALANSLENLMSFSWIAERVEQQKLQLHAWYFELSTGLIANYEKTNNTWNEL
ncbi:MAG: Carbonic anhydrase [Candidatus Dependentiae bacterium ADurb.Bin331]|nr:MAG: Carbonic anhydrase [Candidatus Dependentiae bacterium ADurb.Bin331]